MQLQDFFDYKNRLMYEILTNEKLIKLIQQDTPIEDAESLAYVQIFPWEYVPETVQGGQTFVCFDVDVQRAIGKPGYMPVLYVWVFTHRSNMRLPEGGVRTDAICSEICKMINGSYYYGQGQMDLTQTKRFAPMTDYNGKLLVFTGTEVSKWHDPTREIPGNRKLL